MLESSVPADYRQLDRLSEFSNLTGPYYAQAAQAGKAAEDMALKLGMRIQEKHLNRLGMAHGGALMTLADNAVGDAVAEVFDEPVSTVTVSMNSEFLSPAVLGDWVEAETRVLKKGGRLLFVDCLLWTQGRMVMHATAVIARVNRSTE